MIILSVSSCQCFLCRVFVFISLPSPVDSGLVAALCTQEDAEILFQQNKKALDLRDESCRAGLKNQCKFRINACGCIDNMQPLSHYWMLSQLFSIALIILMVLGYLK